INKKENCKHCFKGLEQFVFGESYQDKNEKLGEINVKAKTVLKKETKKSKKRKMQYNKKETSSDIAKVESIENAIQLNFRETIKQFNEANKEEDLILEQEEKKSDDKKVQTVFQSKKEKTKSAEEKVMEEVRNEEVVNAIQYLNKESVTLSEG
ncbi:hypothetical protein DID76_01085, partial [Candidatus Marinamargulisbacteria bacterium SCGC AG-414-C22]